MSLKGRSSEPGLNPDELVEDGHLLNRPFFKGCGEDSISG